MGDSKSIPRVNRERKEEECKWLWSIIIFVYELTRAKANDNKLIMCLLCWRITKHNLLFFVSKSFRKSPFVEISIFIITLGYIDYFVFTM